MSRTFVALCCGLLAIGLTTFVVAEQERKPSDKPADSQAGGAKPVEPRADQPNAANPRVLVKGCVDVLRAHEIYRKVKDGEKLSDEDAAYYRTLEAQREQNESAVADSQPGGSLEDRIKAAGLDPDRAKELHQKKQNGETLNAEDEAYLKKAYEALGQGQGGKGPPPNAQAGAGGGTLEDRLKAAGLDPERAFKLHQRAQAGEKLSDEDAAYYKKAQEAIARGPQPGQQPNAGGQNPGAGGGGDIPTRLKAAGLDPERAIKLHQAAQRGEKLSDEDAAYYKKAQEALGQRPGANPNPMGRPNPNAGGATRATYGIDKTGFKPLTEMTADDRYLGQDGGLYGGGKNEPPAAHQKAALAARDAIVPLDRDGKPAADGKIVLVSISMSNATQEFSMFKQIADRDDAKSPKLQIVDCAQGGQVMAAWANPNANCWAVAEQRLGSAQVSPAQVQVAWIKLANGGPRGSLEQHARQLQRDTQAVVQNAKAKFPNLKLIYVGTRIFGGYTMGQLNPEPYAYETAFAARWLIQDQIAGNAELNYDPSKGDVKAPVIVWGPYCWGDGVTPRAADKLVWVREDFVGDGTHPSQSGREKVARMLLDFFKSDETAKKWFVK